jgi:hypothetical protein
MRTSIQAEKESEERMCEDRVLEGNGCNLVKTEVFMAAVWILQNNEE